MSTCSKHLPGLRRGALQNDRSWTWNGAEQDIECSRCVDRSWISLNDLVWQMDTGDMIQLNISGPFYERKGKTTHMEENDQIELPLLLFRFVHRRIEKGKYNSFPKRIHLESVLSFWWSHLLVCIYDLFFAKLGSPWFSIIIMLQGQRVLKVALWRAQNSRICK